MKEGKKDAVRVGAYGAQGRRHHASGQVTAPLALDNRVREPAELVRRTPLRDSRFTPDDHMLLLFSMTHSPGQGSPKSEDAAGFKSRAVGPGSDRHLWRIT